jgi:predicted Zn-dependent peptidase
MVSALLGQGACSRFYHAIREQNGLVYSISAEYSPSESDGYFRVYATTSKANIAEVRRLILLEFDRLKTEGVTESEVKRFKDQFLYNYFIGTETSSDRAHMLAGQFLALGHPLSQEERQAEIERITATQLQDVSKDLFVESRMVTVVVGDVQMEGMTPPNPNFEQD